MRTGRLIVIAFSFLLPPAAGAQTVYKSVDAQGNVTYSSTPPDSRSAKSIEEVTIAPPPPESQVREAEERMRRVETEATQARKARADQGKQRSQSVSDAEDALQQARIELQEARIQGDDDWQYLAAGGRVLKQSYFDRVKNAEGKVRKAEEALRNASRGRP